MADHYSQLAPAIAEIYRERDELLADYPASDHPDIRAWAEEQRRDVERDIGQDHFYDERHPWVGTMG